MWRFRFFVVMASAALAAGAPAFARAEPVELPAKLGEGFEVVKVEDKQASSGSPRIYIRKGTRKILLAHAEEVERIDRSARSVTLVIDRWCGSPSTQTWAYTRLDAQLEHERAERLRDDKKDAEAARGFARAVALDPSWNEPAYALATAEARLGHAEAALKALAPWLAKEPIAAYVRVSADRDLAPLLERPALRAIRAKQPGTIALTADGLVGKVAISADGARFAVVSEAVHGLSSSFSSDLEIYDVSSGVQRLLATTPLARDEDSSSDCYPAPGTSTSCRLTTEGRNAVTRRAATLQAMLRELGFGPAASEPVITLESASWHAKQRYAFPKHKLGLVVDNGTARVVQRNTDLGSGQLEHVMHDAIFIEQPSVVAVWSSRFVPHTSCDGPHGSVTLIPIKLP